MAHLKCVCAGNVRMEEVLEHLKDKLKQPPRRMQAAKRNAQLETIPERTLHLSLISLLLPFVYFTPN